MHSFQTLLDDLATLMRNRVRPSGATTDFELDAIPTPTQHRAYELLDLKA